MKTAQFADNSKLSGLVFDTLSMGNIFANFMRNLYLLKGAKDGCFANCTNLSVVKLL